MTSLPRGVGSLGRVEHMVRAHPNGNLICWHCQQPFYAKHPLARYCSYRCTNDAFIARRRESRARAREKVCRTCQSGFIAKRADTKYCSQKCRQAAYRRAVGSDRCRLR